MMTTSKYRVSGPDTGPLLNVYPDSIGHSLTDITKLLKTDEFKGCFQGLYVLPSVFNTDLDRGFSIIDYELNEKLACQNDLNSLEELGVALKLDFVLNHASVLSKQFQDVLQNGQKSKYWDFFINWNEFWDGKGHMHEEGYIEPDEELIKDMFFRKPGLPILKVRTPDGKDIPFWNTFYQEVQYEPVDAYDLVTHLGIQYLTAKEIADKVNSHLIKGLKPREIIWDDYENYREEVVNYLESRRKYLGQMDLNIQSDMVWDFYEETLQKLSDYGAKIVRLDAFAYASKEAGEPNFFNIPGTWMLLEKLCVIARQHEIKLLPEIHSRYSEKIHEEISKRGFMTYDFFLPGLLIDALEYQSKDKLVEWIHEIIEKKLNLVNMLGCHDGIPLLDLEGLISDQRIKNLIDTVINRGGFIKDLHGKTNIYYQVNATYFSALGEDEKKLLLARAIQLFMPGKPQVWYLDLFAGINDLEAVRKAGPGGHKEINRRNLSVKEVQEELKRDVVKKQLELLRFRNTSSAFSINAKIDISDTKDHILEIRWTNHDCTASLEADLKNYTYTISEDESIVIIGG